MKILDISGNLLLDKPELNSFVGANLRNANLYNANLSGANLAGANLAGADLGGADLSNANLYNANLSGAKLGGAKLGGANLRRANLSGADLRRANLSGADLRRANLRNANLNNANLSGADLRNADLRRANLRNANLRNADLRNADLRNADLRNVKLSESDKESIYNTRSITPDGDITVYKKLRRNLVATLKIPAKAKRVGGVTGRKCRAEYAKVVSISGGFKSGYSLHDENFKYAVGRIVRPDRFDENPLIECAPGIHFFVNCSEAVLYDY